MDYHDLSSKEDVDYRKSGFLLAAILLTIYGLLLFRGKNINSLLVGAIVLALLALVKARILDYLVRLLIKLGNMMHKVTNPVVFACVYITAVIPVSMMLKFFKKDILRLNREPASNSYWISRPPIDWKDTFRNQF
jgi:hypothetical protein